VKWPSTTRQGSSFGRPRKRLRTRSISLAWLLKLGLSALAAHALAGIPAAAQIVTSLLTCGSARFERRLLLVFEELNAQQKRIEASIPDRRYYESEEFQTFVGLVIEKLHTTHDEEKLRAFEDALANCGSSEFQPDEKEDYIRTLRDLSINELHILKDNFYGRFHDTDGLGRLVGMGLVDEELEVKRAGLVPRGADSQRMMQELKELVTKPPERAYSLSSFGARFLEFIAASESPASGAGDAAAQFMAGDSRP
jgi:hypothetical protein